MISTAQPAAAILRERHEAWRRQTVWNRLQHVSSQFGAKEALVTVNSDGVESRVTYAQLLAKSERTAAGLFSIGVRRGDRVALWMTNSIEWACVYLATLRIGAILVPLNTWLKAGEATYVLQHSRPRHMIMLDKFRGQNYIGMLNEICPEWANSRPGSMFSEHFPELRTVITLCRSGASAAPALEFHAIEASGANFVRDEPYQAAIAEVTPQDLGVIEYTSGSTGHPKGVLLEQWGLVTTLLLQAERLQTGPEARLFSAMPFFHAGGSTNGLLRMLLIGGTLVFTEAHDAELEIELMERERCTAQWNIPAIFRDQLEVMRRNDKRLQLRWMECNAPERLREIYDRFGVGMVVNIYGITEGYSAQTQVSPDDPPDKRDTTHGKVLPGIEIRLIDPTTQEDVRPGASGEALVRGLLMRGYFDQPDATHSAIDADGWYHTGDLVSVDSDGYYNFIGRLKAMLKVGGENVAAEEVENYIRKLPGIVDCCVVGVPDAHKDEVPLAFVSVAPGSRVTTDDIIEGCAKGLARFKVPRYVEFLESIPLLGINKIDRKALKDRAAEWRNLDSAPKGGTM